MSVAERFSENLIRLRKQAGLSQEQLGFAAALHRTEIGELERGYRLPRIDTLLKLSGALGVAPGELLAGIEWRPAPQQPGTFDAPDAGATL